MKISEMFPSNYLKADDLAGDTLATITAVKLEPIGPDKKQKPTIYFREFTKPLVANKTNSNTIAEIYGDNTDAWTGKKVVLFKTWVDFQGKSIEALRVRAPKLKSAAALPVEAPVESEYNEEESAY
jgi:hypothetical protein